MGELFQSVAVSRSRQSISDLMDIRPDYANVEREGELVQVDPLIMTAGTYNHPGKGSPFDEQSKEYRDNLKESMKNRNFSARGDR